MMLTKAYDDGSSYRFVVLIDGTKVLPDGSPDPAWTKEYTWGKEPPQGQTAQDYLASCKREAELLAALDPRLQPPPQEILLP